MFVPFGIPDVCFAAMAGKLPFWQAGPKGTQIPIAAGKVLQKKPALTPLRFQNHQDHLIF